MKRFATLVATFLAVGGLLGASPAAGAEQALAFVRGLQEKGYADVSVDYLRWLSKQGNMPEDIADVFDLEMSKSLRGAANTAFNAEEARQMTAEAQKHLDKFLKEKPDHPDVVSAVLSWANFSVDQALQTIRAAQTVVDKNQQAKRFEEARAMLEDARPRYHRAIAEYQKRVAKEMPSATGSSSSKSSRSSRARSESKAEKAAAARRARIELDWLDARFRLGLIDYYVAQTYPDPKNSVRVKSLRAAAETFDDIYQANRVNAQGQVSLIGLTCHMWHGKTMEDLGELQTAEDIYDEVLANADPSATQSQAHLEPLFAQVAYFRFMIYKRKAQPEDFIAEARQWLAQYRTFSRTDGFQGVALETAKAMLAAAEKGGGDKRKMAAEAQELLRAMAKINSQHQQEAIMILRAGAKAATTDPQEIKVFDEAVALGNQAAQQKQWASAVSYYERGLEIAQAPGPRMPKPERLAEVRETIIQCNYMVARDLLEKEKYQEGLDLCRKIMRDGKESSIAPAVAELAVKAAFGVYVNSPPNEREAARERVSTIAKFTIDNWPNKPEADGVRILQGQLNVGVGRIEEALKSFEAVNPRSERYPVALFMSGRTYWFRYLLAKMNPQADKKQMAADRDLAFKQITQSLEMQRKTLEPGKPMPQQMIETQLELADVYSERGDFKEAVALYQPLVEIVKEAKPQSLDMTTMRIFTGAVKAFLSTNDLAKASEAGMVLAELGEDNLQVNGVLVQFAGGVDGERRKAEQLVASPSADPKEVAAAKAKIPGLRDILGKLLTKLFARQQHGPAQMLYIADACSAMNMSAEAKTQYERFLDQLKDQEFAKIGSKYETRARSQLIGLLRKEGNSEEAMNQVERLISAYPRALEPLLEKGMILQAWAEKDSSIYDKAIAHWTDLRNKLMTVKRKPPQYYDVLFHLAECLVAQAKKLSENGDAKGAAEKAKQGEQLLKATITLSPTLGGRRSLVGEYGVLIDKAIVLQGRTPDKKPETPAPAAESKPAEAKPAEAKPAAASK